MLRRPATDLPLWAAAFATSVAYGITLPGLPQVLASAGRGVEFTGRLMAAYSAAVVVAAPLVARACRRWPVTRIAAFGLLGQALALALHALPPDFAALLAARVALGLSAAAVLVALPMHISDPLCAGARREHRLSELSRGAILGGLAGPAVGGLVAAGPSLGAAALVGAVTLIGAWALVARAPPQQPAAPCPPTEAHRGRQHLLAALAALAAAGMALYEVGLATYGRAVLGLTTRGLGAMFVGCSMVMLVVQMTLFRRNHDPLRVFAWAGPAFLTMALALLVLVLVPRLGWAWTGLVLVAGSAGVLQPALAYWAGRAAGAGAAGGQGWRIALTTCGQALGSLAGGYVFASGAFGRALLTAFVFSLVIAAATAYAIRRRPAAVFSP